MSFPRCSPIVWRPVQCVSPTQARWDKLKITRDPNEDKNIENGWRLPPCFPAIGCTMFLPCVTLLRPNHVRDRMNRPEQDPAGRTWRHPGHHQTASHRPQPAIHTYPPPAEEATAGPVPAPGQLRQAPDPAPRQLWQAPVPAPRQLWQAPVPAPRQLRQAPVPAPRQLRQAPAPAALVQRPPPVPAPAALVQRPPPVPTPAALVQRPPPDPAPAALVQRPPPDPASAPFVQRPPPNPIAWPLHYHWVRHRGRLPEWPCKDPGAWRPGRPPEPLSQAPHLGWPGWPPD
ncbi:basic proline-rich protein-like isoform X1 [Phyllopteryx taeniolatus]|uniref:basic proline-rich protein-like isoform X1 n=1 Tax=Phyllopteryx taeniolatus TaxID=161469 RepID=UPI002AD4E061|nr:basic proline-rich protein-like isoform X1 [Phyllopteryx taeniolatus]XP_061641372.1 basic proline-rich protein-like isoform X1 [Phyllopteryx taeniolatus]